MHTLQKWKIKMLTPFLRDTEKISLSDERRISEGLPREHLPHILLGAKELFFICKFPPLKGRLQSDTVSEWRQWWWDKVGSESSTSRSWDGGRHQGNGEAKTLRSGSQCKHNESLCHKDSLTCSLPSEVTWLLRRETWEGRPPCEDGQKLELCYHEAGNTRAASNAGSWERPAILLQSSQQEQTLSTPWFHTSKLQNFERINLCCFTL